MNNIKSLKAVELFPQLKDTENKRRFLEFIKTKDLSLFCEECMKKAFVDFNDRNLLVAENVLDMMIRKELLTENNHQSYVDALLIAAHLFDACYNESNKEDYSALFKARIMFDEVADRDIYEYGPLPEQMREMIWDTIESQLGDCTPMSKTKPSPNTPQDLFAMSIYIADKIIENKK